ncbi:MAG: CoA protein activase [Bacillota bacterium]|nr:CoA protein activase [Bacillota bacterium]
MAKGAVVTFPRMGSAVPVFRTILEDLGVEVLVPPNVGPITVSLGVRHSPECACYPLKINLGNYLEAARRGANTVLMIGGIGPCRLGYYAEVQREVLADLGVDMRMVVLEPPVRGWRQLAHTIADITGSRPWSAVWRAVRLGWLKLNYLDNLEAMSHHLRPREARRGTVSKALSQAREWLDEARTFAAVNEAGHSGMELLASVPCRETAEPPVRVGVIGEIFMVLEPAVNMGCQEALGHLGAEVEQGVWLSGWVRENVFPKPWKPRGTESHANLARLAAPYINHWVGGEGQLNVGHTIEMARRGLDGVVHLAPFTCMPEIVARTALDAVSQDYGIPVLTFFLDEHAGEAGMQTRLEAFADLLRRRRRGEAPKAGA